MPHGVEDPLRLLVLDSLELKGSSRSPLAEPSPYKITHFPQLRGNGLFSANLSCSDATREKNKTPQQSPNFNDYRPSR